MTNVTAFQDSISERRGCELIDILSYSFNLEIILVKADVEQVSLTLADIFLGRIEFDVDIQMPGDRLHALVFQFKGHSWTLFTFNTHRDRLAQRISEQLRTKCIHLGYSDTIGWAEYELYDTGKCVEAYAFGTNYSEEEVPESLPDTNGFQDNPVFEYNRPWNLVSISSDESWKYQFFSLKQKVSSTDIQNPKKFLDRLFRSQDAWLPALEYWFFHEYNPNLDSNIFVGVNAIKYKPIV